MKKLISSPNVITSPHPAFLTEEALQEITLKTIANLDKWPENKCVGKSCACNKQSSSIAEVKTDIS